MKKLLKAALLAITAAVLLTLTACGTKIATVLSFDKEFAGTRTIACSIDSGSAARIGEQALDDLVRQNCPQQLTYEKTKTGAEVTYTFTLAFTDLSDYKAKAEALLGRKPAIVFAAPDNIFVQGMRLSEDFTSEDLMNWFYALAVQKGLIQNGQALWNSTAAQVVYNGTKTDTKTPVDINQLTYRPVDKISIQTLMKADGTFARTVIFQLPDETLSAVGSALEPYMQQRVPEGGTGTWSTVTTGKTFTVTFSAASADELSGLTATVLDTKEAAASVKDDETTPFLQQSSYEEELNLSSFVSGRNGKVFVDYSFVFEDASGLRSAELFTGGRWADVSSSLSGGTFSLAQDMSVLNVRLMKRTEYKVNAIAIHMNIAGADHYIREVRLTFDSASGADGAKRAASHYSSLQAPGTVVTSEASDCIIRTEGTAVELTQALTLLFGQGNGVTVQKDDGFKLNNSEILTEAIDLSSLQKTTGFTGQIRYVLSAQTQVEAFSVVPKSGGSAMPTEAAQGTISSALPADGSAQVTVTSTRVNILFACVAGGSFLLLLAAAVIIVTIAVKRSKAAKESAQLAPVQVVSPAPAGPVCPACGKVCVPGMIYCMRCGHPLYAEPQPPGRKELSSPRKE